ncbi:helix-turn-helix transcriptional regulator [Luteococcus sp.]|uniref:helix-turn-helix transcriptional regulator n=1 Tax=Luteococcus sp. TaxID=1969402 RepID=UPI0037365E60
MDTNVGRALRTLELVQARPGIGGEELARRLGTSVRAVRRTIGALRDAGFTITSVPGPGGGYRLDRGPRMPMVFTEQELTAIAMSLVESSGSFSDSTFETAAAKVLRAMPVTAAAPARSVLASAVAMPDSHAVGPVPELVLQLARAIDNGVLVGLHYRTPSKDGVEQRLMEPWSLIVRHGRWYLFGRSMPTGARRTYRVDRVVQVDPTGEAFTRPEDVDIARDFDEHLRTSWKYPTRVAIAAPLEVAKKWLPSTMGELTSTGDNSCLLEGRTNNCTAYLTDLLQTPFSFSVLGGPELTQAAAQLRARITAATSQA